MRFPARLQALRRTAHHRGIEAPRRAVLGPAHFKPPLGEFPRAILKGKAVMIPDRHVDQRRVIARQQMAGDAIGDAADRAIAISTAVALEQLVEDIVHGHVEHGQIVHHRRQPRRAGVVDRVGAIAAHRAIDGEQRHQRRRIAPVDCKGIAVRQLAQFRRGDERAHASAALRLAPPRSIQPSASGIAWNMLKKPWIIPGAVAASTRTPASASRAA